MIGTHLWGTKNVIQPALASAIERRVCATNKAAEEKKKVDKL